MKFTNGNDIDFQNGYEMMPALEGTIFPMDIERMDVLQWFIFRLRKGSTDERAHTHKSFTFGTRLE
jgi:hypothetical protein